MTDDDALTTAPMLRGLHARHPDVDVVVLPPPPPARPAPAPCTPAALERELDAVTGEVAALLAAVRGATRYAHDRAGDHTETVWRTGARPGLVTPVAESRTGAPEGTAATDLATGLARAAHHRGWVGRVRATGTTTRLDCEQQGRTLRVVRLDDAVLVTLTGRALPVTVADARRLVSGLGPR